MDDLNQSGTGTEASQAIAGQLRALGIRPGDGLFVHASARSIGTLGTNSQGSIRPSAEDIINGMMAALGPQGLLAMPGFSTDAYLPEHLDPAQLNPAQLREAERAVPGHDPDRSDARGMGVIAETFRRWPGTLRSPHPTTSVCVNGPDAGRYALPHPWEWATGPDSPMGRLSNRPGMKILLVGVGWNRCSALHTAEFFAEPRRTKTRRFKTGPAEAEWAETPDVADDLNRLFPDAGAAYEATGAVTTGKLGEADCRLCGYADLVRFAAGWIGRANAQSGVRH